MMKVVGQLLVPEVAEGCLRVAFATKDGKSVNEHFGWGRDFVIYDVSSEGARKVGKMIFSGEGLDERGNDDKLSEKIAALEDCHIVYSQAIGGPAAARLTRKKIQPMVVMEEKSIEGLLEELTARLKRPMPPWLRKITKPDDPARFDGFDDEDEDDDR